MAVSSDLLDGWRVLMASFHLAVSGNLREDHHKPSFVLPLPTGSGKTEGACVYAALQAHRNVGHPNPVGVLVVTRLTEDAEKLAVKINTETGRPVAMAHHSENRQSAQVLAEHDVVVITHARLLSAAKDFKEHKPDKWTDLYTWSRGVRSLIIVDEALANAVNHNEVTSKSLGTVLRAVPAETQKEHPEAMGVLQKLKGYLETREKEHVSGDDVARMLWRSGPEVSAQQVRKLRDALRERGQFPTELFNEDAPRTVGGILEDVEALLSSFAYHYRAGAIHSLNSARYLLPEGMPGLVVLDATADRNLIYELLGSGVYIVPVPPRIRDYSNVTLHVARTSAGLGKTKMEETKHTRLPRLAAELAKEIGPGRSVFLCVHKHAKDLAATYSSESLPLRVGWWGAVDGKNDWKDCDTAVIFGLPYMNPKTAINTVFATTGPKDNAWLKAPPVYDHKVSILDVMAVRDTAASVVQAINRIRHRRMTDAQGGCERTDVYIVLPKDWRGDSILNDILLNMPGIKEVPWDFEPDGPKVYVPRPGSANDAIVGLMRDHKPGKVPLPTIRRELSLSKSQDKRAKEDLAKPDSKLTTALRDIGVLYVVEGKGRGAKSYLAKAA